MSLYYRHYRESLKGHNAKIYRALNMWPKVKKKDVDGQKKLKSGLKRESKLSRKISRATLKAAIRTKRITEFKGKGKVNYPTRWNARRKNWRRIHNG